MKVKRMLRKSLAMLMAVCMAIQMGSMSFAASDEGYVEIVVDCNGNCEKEQMVANIFSGETSTSEFVGIVPTANILCLFGHSWAEGRSIVIEHRYWATSPRCRQTTYRVDYCTRSGCDRLDLTQLTQIRISCCA